MSKFIKPGILLFLFIISLRPPLDLDLGWHLKYGEYFFKNGHVLMENIYSSVWPGYPWVQASWGYDLLLYQIYNHFGFFGISLAGALTTVLIFYLITKPLKNPTFFILLLLLFVFVTQAGALYQAAFRSQTPSALVFTIILISVSAKLLFQSKSRLISFLYYALPLQFLIWANLHGGFLLGFVIIGLIWISIGILLILNFVKNTQFIPITYKTYVLFSLLIFISFLVTFINPWDIRLHLESLRHSTNPNLMLIEEWQPRIYYPFDAILTGLVAIFTFFTALKRKKATDIPYLVAFSGMTYFAFSANRFALPFGIMSVYYLSHSIPSVKFLYKNTYQTLFIFISILLIAIDLIGYQRFFYIPDPRITQFNWEYYCDILQDCSNGITKIMQENPPSGNGIHPYNYGGYLIWNMPQIKVFVDGRMAAWQDDDGKTPPVYEVTGLADNSAPLFFTKLNPHYNFKWAIVYTNTPLQTYLENQTASGKWIQQYQDKFYSYYTTSE